MRRAALSFLALTALTSAAVAAPQNAMSPHDILTAYSKGEISSSAAIALLGLDTYRDLFLAMCDAGHPLPRPPSVELERQVAAALPILRAALIPPENGG